MKMKKTGIGARPWRPMLSAGHRYPLHPLSAVHDRRSPSDRRQKLWWPDQCPLSVTEIREIIESQNVRGRLTMASSLMKRN